MKKHLFLAFTFLILLGCNEKNVVTKNPYLPEYPVDISLNLNLPLYSILNTPSNAVYYSTAGIRGIFIFNTGSGITAFDAACPNQNLTTCSTMTLKGINAVCPCDNKEYSLFTGLSDLQYPLKQYRTEVSGNIIHIYN
jgi:nitrite reductase/ring-hydroxylating ferredoxin subunit